MHDGGQFTEAALLRAFPRAADYRALWATRPSAVREGTTGGGSFPYSERHLQCVWADARWRPQAMQTADGESVTVIEPGRWNLEAGPDFLDALLDIGPGRRVAGDVEVHIRPADWHQHGHADDSRYARVAAHVTYFPGGLPAGTLPPRAVHVPLREALRANADFSFESIDVAAYPFAQVPSGQPPCNARLADWAPREHAALLESAGEARLLGKAQRLAAAMREQGAPQVLYEELLSAMGYKHNRQTCRTLARRLPLEALREEAGSDALQAYAVLIGVAGLLPERPSTRWDDETKAFVRCLWDAWWKRAARWEAQVMARSAWQLSGLRPQNHPARRLAAAAALVASPVTADATVAEWDTTDPDRWLRLAAAFLGSADGVEYWLYRLGFAGRRRTRPCALVGARRAAAVVTNVLVPFAAAIGRPIDALLAGLPAEEENSLARHTAHALFGRDHNPALYGCGLRQQGLLQIFYDFCLTDRSGCRDCALADALARHSRGALDLGAKDE